LDLIGDSYWGFLLGILIGDSYWGFLLGILIGDSQAAFGWALCPEGHRHICRIFSLQQLIDDDGHAVED
jgi:hypothetical protein